MQDRLNKIRAKALSRRNVRPTTFQSGDHVKIWNHRVKRYDTPAIVDSAVAGDDTLCRSYKVIGEDGRLRHVTGAWLVPAEAQQ